MNEETLAKINSFNPAATLYFRAEARPISELKPLWRKFGQDVSFGMWLLLRDRARKDLFWLGKKVLRKDLAACHVEPCSTLFVQKDFNGVYHEGYSIGEVHAAIDRQKREKEMLWLDPRGAFKSTLDGIDCLQWMLNCPDIRILILTGEYKLALAFMSEIKGYFYLAEKAERLLLHKMFPEYILVGKDGTSKEPIDCPARIHNQKEPTLWVNSIEASLSGWHCDIRKGDDVITDENCNTPETREKIKLKYDGTKNLLDEWGFSDTVGTRYFVDDWYGKRIAVSAEVPLRYLRRACWTVKEEFKDVPLRQIESHMVDLLFPEKLTFKSLKQKLMENEKLFRCQQLNEPALDDGSCTFDEATLRLHLVNEVPSDGDIVITWDWSFGRQLNYADYSAGAVARVHVKPDEPPQLYILEIVFGRWKPSQLAFEIVQLEKKWKPRSTLIEKSNGAELLQMEIARQAQKYQVPLKIIWKEVSNAADAKRNNIKGVETLINNDQLWFLRGSWIEETFLQLVRYTGERKNRGRKDDIPDTLGFLAFFLPSTTNTAELEKLKRQQEHVAESKMFYDHIFKAPVITPRPIETPSLKRQLFGSLAR